MLFTINIDKTTQLIQRIAARCYDEKHSLELRIENKTREGVLELHASRKMQQKTANIASAFHEY